MKKMRKILGVTLSAAALMAASVFGTMAYLTDTEAVTNTFTVGKVQITLDEAKVDEMGKPDGTTRWQPTEEDPAQEYHLIPGHEYTKDPTIHVDADSENCYLFVKVENGIADIETKTGKTIAAQMKEIGWVEVDGDKGIYVLAKGENDTPDYTYTVGGGAHVEVFNEFTVDGDSVDNDKIAEYAKKEVVVTAYAVQAAGFDTSLDAWAATFGK